MSVRHNVCVRAFYPRAECVLKKIVRPYFSSAMKTKDTACYQGVYYAKLENALLNTSEPGFKFRHVFRFILCQIKRAQDGTKR